MKKFAIGALVGVLLFFSFVTDTSAYTRDYSSYQREKQRNYENYQRQKQESYYNNRDKSYAERRADYERIYQENRRIYEDTYNKYHDGYYNTGVIAPIVTTPIPDTAQPSIDNTAINNASLPVLDNVMVSADKVNVRQQPTTKSKSFGKVNKGFVLTRFENRADGWSGVYYANQIAYIKTEFLLNATTGLPANM